MFNLAPTSEAAYAPMFYGVETARLFGANAQFGCMIQFEIALAEALEEEGISPVGTAEATRAACPLPPIGEAIPWLDLEAIARESVTAGNLAIPFVKHLTGRVAAHSPSAAAFVHFGATSQDVLDTALVLQLSLASALLEQRLNELIDALVKLVETHRGTLMPGRTWIQQGPPITFGLKAAGWLSAILRQQSRLQAASRVALVIQFGGAVGTLASLAAFGPSVASALARALKLACPTAPWHTQRDSLADLAATFANITGTLGKVARDISLLMQTEVAEAFEPASEGKGSSSTMPHKRNPVACANILSAANRTPHLAAIMFAALPQEHERGLGGWHAEWQTMPELTLLTLGAAGHSLPLLQNLEVDPLRMRRNLEATQGYAMGESVVSRLAPVMGRLPAHHLIETLTRHAMANHQTLHEVLATDTTITSHLTPSSIADALDPNLYLGSTAVFIDAVLKAAATQRESR